MVPAVLAVGASAFLVFDLVRVKPNWCIVVFAVFPITAWTTAIVGSLAFGAAGVLAMIRGAFAGRSDGRLGGLWYLAAVPLIGECAYIAFTIGHDCPAWPFL